MDLVISLVTILDNKSIYGYPILKQNFTRQL
jgi:hypothetical protein